MGFTESENESLGSVFSSRQFPGGLVGGEREAGSLHLLHSSVSVSSTSAMSLLYECVNTVIAGECWGDLLWIRVLSPARGWSQGLTSRCRHPWS